MVKQSAKRQKRAQEQFEHLNEFTPEQFAMFMQVHSVYIPYRTLWGVIGRNKQLLNLFNQFATDDWWRDRVRNDFYDYYNVIVVPGKPGIKQKIIDWMSTSVTSSAHALKKPWKLVYMTCYGIFNLLNAQYTPFRNGGRFEYEDLVDFGEGIDPRPVTKIWGDFVITQRQNDVTVESWLTGELLKVIPRKGGDITLMPVLNGVIMYEGDSMTLYDRVKDELSVSKAYTNILNPISTDLGELLYTSRPVALVTHKKHLDKKVELPKEFPKLYYALGQDYYAYGNKVFQWPETPLLKMKLPVEYSMRGWMGPFNFDRNQFIPILFHIYYLTLEVYPNGLQPIALESEPSQFSYGFMTGDEESTRINAPSGDGIRIMHPISLVYSICGPFMLVNEPHYVFALNQWRRIDLWTTLQNEMEEPLTFVSENHCQNCGFVAQFQCDGCGSTFCHTKCATQHYHYDTIGCNHGVE